MQKNNSIPAQRPVVIKHITVTGMLSALAFALMSLDFPLLFFFPEYLKIDFSDLPALIAAIFINPLSGITVELIKNLLHLFIGNTGGVGELSNFLVGVAFVLPASVIFRFFVRKREEKKADFFISMITASLFMAVAGALVNYYIILPFYSKIMPIDTIIGLSSKILPFVKSKLDVIIFSIIPFNLLKAAVISLIFVFIYKLLHNPIKRFLK